MADTREGFFIEVPPGPVRGIATQNGRQVDRWEDIDLGQPWFWTPPPPPPAPAENLDLLDLSGWTEIGYTDEGFVFDQKPVR